VSAPSATPQRTSRGRRAIVLTVIVIVAVVALFFIASSFAADILWYQQLGFLNVLTTEWVARLAMWVIGFLGIGIPVWLGINIAYRTRPVYAQLGAQLDRYQAIIEPLRRVAMWLVPAILGAFGGFAASAQWTTVALWLNRTPFGEVDPEFGFDISFFVFELPFYRGVVTFALWAVGLATLLTLATVYLYGSIRVVGRQIRISRAARIQLAIMLGLYIALQGVSLWLDQYAFLSEAGVGFLATGAGYTEVNALIPGKAILAGAALLVAIACFVTAVIGRWRIPIIGVALLIVLSLVVGAAYPWIVQRFQVEPSAKTYEAPFIEREIAATRTAFGVADVEEIPYSAVTDAEPGALREDAETTASIRILDPAIAPRAFAQLQQIKQYYTFPNRLDVDRYEIDGTTQDTVIAVRELNQAGLGDSRSWYNDSVVYTHGIGVVAAYGNQRESDGQPLFLEKDIPPAGELGEFEPRVYFGENSPEYSIVGAPEGSTPVELDYPAGGVDSTQTITTTFSGDGGPKLDNLFTRLVYAIKFQSEQILFSDAVNSESQILYDRNPRERVQRAAPYLTLDNDIYPAIVDGRIVWIVDGYTTTNKYPYSQTVDLISAVADADTPVSSLRTLPVNYVRNSVKATVDAYDGSVTLYAWDAEDPVLATWQKVFPSTVRDASEMSTELLDHVRYPADLFKVQRQVLGAYHVTDPGVFYSGEDQWVTPADPVDNPSGALQPPYYLTMEVPGSDDPAFTIYSTYIPRATAGAQRDVLTGYLAANADAGDNYGKLTLLTLPTQSIPGPGQVFNNFKTDAIVSAEILGLTGGSSNDIIYGNLLTLPVGGGLLYVQPVYVQAASGTQYPLLRKVLVGFGDGIAFEDTLDEALDVLFGGDSGANAGDSGEGGSGETPGTPTPNPTPTPTPTPTAEPTPSPTPTGEPTPTPTIPPLSEAQLAALADALADYEAALAARTAAYASGDLVAAAQADERMQDAIERANAAVGQ